MMGSTPTMVDAACAPWLLRAFVVRDLRQIDILQGFAKLNQWLQAYRSACGLLLLLLLLLLPRLVWAPLIGALQYL